MSLKALHIVFIAASIGLSLGMGGWWLNQYSKLGDKHDLVWGVLSVLAGIVLLVYGKLVLKKLKNISYL